MRVTGLARPLRVALIAASLASLLSSSSLGIETLPHRQISLALPGIPAKLIPADLNRDGIRDLLVVLVYTEYEEVAFDRIQGFVQLTEVVPALSERRELRAYLQRSDGSYRLAGQPVELPLDVTAMSAGPPGAADVPVIALTRIGASALQIGIDAPVQQLGFRPLITEPPVLGGSRAFLPELELVENLDGDESPDILFPGRAGHAVFLGTSDGISMEPAARLILPGDERGTDQVVWRRYPIPTVQDLNGDGLPDMVVRDRESADREIQVLPGAGEGRFHPVRAIDTRCAARAGLKKGSRDLIHLGDLDGQGGAEVVFRREIETEEDGLDEAREPRAIYRFHHLREDLGLEPEPYFTMEGVGHPFEGQWAGRSSESFRDLDGDGRRELITVNLDFSVLQVLRVLATKKIGIGLDFQIWRQEPDGGFRKVENLKLSDKILLDLNDIKLDRLGNFAGDFDGDGRLDFLTLEGGRTLRIHSGAPGCAYSRKADFKLKLPEEPPDPGLVKVADLDGDGRADLAITRPLDPDPSGAGTPVSLDLYLSGGP